MKLKEWILEKENKSKDKIDEVIIGGVVVFGVIGEFFDKDFLLFLKGNVGFLLKKFIEDLYCFMFYN